MGMFNQLKINQAMPDGYQSIENMNYDQEELEILDFMENGNYVSVPNVKEEMEEIKASVKEKFKQKRTRINQNEFQSLKK
jgi:hypothetical protein